jgi:hypothetical protein
MTVIFSGRLLARCWYIVEFFKYGSVIEVSEMLNFVGVVLRAWLQAKRTKRVLNASPYCSTDKTIHKECIKKYY